MTYYLINQNQAHTVTGKDVRVIVMDSPTWKVDLFWACKQAGHQDVSLHTPARVLVNRLGAIDKREWPRTCPRCGGKMGSPRTSCLDCGWQPVGV